MRALVAGLSVTFLHEGEEFVLALPVVMLGAAFFLMRWASAGGDDAENEDDDKQSPPTTEAQPRTEELVH